ncbi:MAG: pyridoxal phosphate-dependent aminotransferase, partial [Bacillota bacterium]|nr:pyridoxal phosphate-dependent aminotransferase [Bacillota bacterium]
MRTFSKSVKLNNVCYDVRGPVLDEAAKLEAAGASILKLNIGNPAPFGFSAPASVMESMEAGLLSAQGYSDTRGVPEAREAVAAYCLKKNISGVSPDDVYTGNGVSELITICMQGLLNDGDEVLIPAPDYPLWTAAVTLAGGKAVHYLCDEKSDWMPDLEDMRRKISPRTKGLVVINPNNPTGALYPPEILEKIAGLAREAGLILFADEIYDRLVMDGLSHTSIAALAPDLFVVTLNGLSKSHLVAGYRCGWMCLSGDKSGASGYIEGLNMLASMRLCSNVPAQYAIRAALADENSAAPLLTPGGRIYEQRKAICSALREIEGLSLVAPKAAFYVFPKIDTARFRIR